MKKKKEFIKVYGMTCSSCEARVKNVLKKVDGVKEVGVSFREELAAL